MKNPLLYLCLIGGLGLLCWNCQTETQYEKGSVEHIKEVTAKVDDALLAAQETQHGDWLTYGRNYKEDRYSLLDQIINHEKSNHQRFKASPQKQRLTTIRRFSESREKRLCLLSTKSRKVWEYLFLQYSDRYDTSSIGGR